jgi:hypothetical protein
MNLMSLMNLMNPIQGCYAYTKPIDVSTSEDADATSFCAKVDSSGDADTVNEKKEADPLSAEAESSPEDTGFPWPRSGLVKGISQEFDRNFTGIS